MSWRKFAYHHGGGERDGGSTLFECCNQRGFGHLLAVCPQRWDVVGRGGSCSMSDQWLETMQWNLPFFVLDLGLYIINGIRRLHFKSYCLAGEGLNEDLHDRRLKMVGGEVEVCWSSGKTRPAYIGWCGDWNENCLTEMTQPDSDYSGSH